MPRRQDVTGKKINIPSHKRWGLFGLADRAPPKVVYEEDEAWLPSAGLISILPALSDLTYNCINQFSPCLLQALHTYHPGCRLYLERFQLVSVNDIEPDAHEIALGTSRCLYSLTARYATVTGNHTQDFTHQAMLKLIAGLAPNLKAVSIRRKRPRPNLAIPTSPGHACESLKSSEIQTSQGLLALGSLRILRMNSYSNAGFYRLAQKIDISVLRVLDLCQYTVDVGTLNYLASECRLSSLKEFSFSLGDFDRASPKTYDDVICRLLRSLLLLTCFNLTGYVTQAVFDAIISNHGSELQNMQLKMNTLHINSIILTHQDIKIISDVCLKLETLAISIPRSGGDRNEVAIYQSIGLIKSLRHLILQLDACLPPIDSINNESKDDGEDEDEDDERYETSNYDGQTPNDPRFDEFQAELYRYQISNARRLRNGHIMNAMINSTLDESLARAIFRVMDSSKAGAPTRLQTLHLCTVGGSVCDYRMMIPGGFGELVGATRVIAASSRVFYLERSPRDDRSDELIITDLTRSSELDIFTSSEQLEECTELIFRRLWPGSGGKGGDWREEWSSFPLHEA